LNIKTDKTRWSFRIYYVAFIIAGAATFTYFVGGLPHGHWGDIFLFVVLIIIADFVQVPLPSGGSSISTSSTIDFAGIILFGPAVMVVVETIAIFFTEGVLQRKPIRKLAFNIPLLVITVGISGYVYKVFGSLGTPDSPIFLIPLLAAGIVYYLVNTWAISLVIAFDSGKNPYYVWKQNYMWYFFHIFAFLPIGAVIALLYSNVGEWTIALFIIPLFLARYSFQLYLDMRETNIETVTALTSAIDASDAYTHGHSSRVSAYALRVAERMNWSSKDMETLQYAALLHDVGKIAVNNEILHKVGPLTEDDWDSLRSHSDIGADIVEQLKFLKTAAQIIRCHHERPDGKGYPRGLKEDEIPMGAHILNVVDAFDAMTSDRPYRKALPIEKVIKELETNKGTQFQRDIADLILHLYSIGEFPVLAVSDMITETANLFREKVQV
jgi:putative nucleotidyltransferase with HDIG domain